jgi:uncharacterized membrane protein
MYRKHFPAIKSLLKSIVVVGLVVSLVVGQAQGALAASRSGGRVGGGSFRAPSSRTYSAPRGGYRQPTGGGYGTPYYGGGGGFGFPFLLPYFGWGIGSGGGLFSLLIFMVIASFIVQTFRRFQEDGGFGGETASDPKVSIARLQVGLLAQARELQSDLDRIALNANTSSSEGLTKVLQETTLALLRHPEYWAYAGSEAQQTRLSAAEAQFNRYSLAERSKFSSETLSNFNNQLKQAPTKTALLDGDHTGTPAQPEAPGEYIVATVIVGAQGKLQLPEVRNPDELRQALNILGGVSSDQLLAVEVLWTPEADGDVLTSEDLIVDYPNLKLI